MDKSRKAMIVDGYAAMKAAQHAVKVAKAPERGNTRSLEKSRAVVTKETPKPAAHICRTVAPSKHPIQCYNCGYTFLLHGRAPHTVCSKCRISLNLKDHTIESRWTETLKTTGIIRLTSRAVLQSGELVGRDVILEGTIKAGSIRALQKLELGAGAAFPERAVTGQDLKVANGAVVNFKRKAQYRHVEVCGGLNAKLQVSGIVTIRAGGLLQGELNGEHIVVEEGGGLKAKLRIEPTATPKERPQEMTP